jgi:predicted nuclease with TOPRIM domain
MMSIFEKRIQERDAELEDQWTKMLEATAERDSAKMDLMTERALWNEEKKVLQQKIVQLETQLQEHNATIEGACGNFLFVP